MPRWPLIVLLCGAMLCLVLTFWQWQRGQQKAAIESVLQSDLVRDLRTTAVDSAGQTLDYQRVRLTGYYLPEVQFPLSYRIHHRQSGYEMLTLFRLMHSTEVVVVNRGWLAAEQLDRDMIPATSGSSTSPQSGSTDNLLPPVEAPASSSDRQRRWQVPSEFTDVQRPVSITGRLLPYSRGFRLGDNQLRMTRTSSGALIPLLYIDRQDIEQISGREVSDWMLSLDEQQPAALSANWPGLALTSSKHYAYATQWLLLALLQLLASAVLGWRGYASRRS